MTTMRGHVPPPARRAGGAAALVAAALATLLALLPVRAETEYAYRIVTKTNPPASMRPGQAYPLIVVLRNEGTATWRSEETADERHPLRLGTVGPRDRASAFGTDDAAWIWSGGRRIRMLTPVVEPGGNAVFAFTFTAPAEPGTYPEERFAPLAEGLVWMDAEHIVFPGVTVPNPGAAPAIPKAAMPQPPCTPSRPEPDGPRAPAYSDAGPPAVALGYESDAVLAPEWLSAPSAVALAANGDVVVADAGAGTVTRLRPDATRLYTFGGGVLSSPMGVAVTANGFVYVADTGNDRIRVWTLFGIPVASFGSSGNGPGELSAPAGLALIDAGPYAGALAVADAGNDRVQILSSSGAHLATIGEPGSAPGQLSAPLAVSVYGGHVYVADTGNDRVQRFTLDGAFAGRIGGPGDGVGCVRAPSGVAAGPFGVYVADAGNRRLHHFTRGGALLETFGEPLAGASGVAVDPGGAVWTAERDLPWLHRFAPAAEAAPLLPCGSDPAACLPGG